MNKIREYVKKTIRDSLVIPNRNELENSKKFEFVFEEFDYISDDYFHVDDCLFAVGKIKENNHVILLFVSFLDEKEQFFYDFEEMYMNEKKELKLGELYGIKGKEYEGKSINAPAYLVFPDYKFVRAETKYVTEKEHDEKNGQEFQRYETFYRLIHDVKNDKIYKRCRFCFHSKEFQCHRFPPVPVAIVTGSQYSTETKIESVFPNVYEVHDDGSNVCGEFELKEMKNG